MFDKAINFNKPLNAWDVREVPNMKWMFYGASRFNQNLSGWNTPRWLLCVVFLMMMGNLLENNILVHREHCQL
jgi:hypothetical protein